MQTTEIQVTEAESRVNYQAECEAFVAEAERIFFTVSYNKIFLMVREGKMKYDVFAAVLDMISDKAFEAGFKQGKLN